MALADLGQSRQAVAVRHSDIEEYHVDLVLADGTDGLVACARVGDDFDISAGEQTAEAGSDDLVIVGN
jgi:hypothetical protein